ncbi:recombinase family protein [Methylobacterium sp. 1030]|uniref:recombinase family protein n=1 Tax=Methylobacterium sp. 1030 TaxID=3156404 RepID=UPI003390839B
MPNVLGYARVSTSDQDLNAQRRRLTEDAGAIRVFDDIGVDKRADRPGLSEMLGFCRTGDTICVVRLDRLGRSLREVLETIDPFKARGLAFRSLEEGLDIASAARELAFHFFGTIAHYECLLINEHSRDRNGSACARDKRHGQSANDIDKLASALKLVEGGIPVAQAARSRTH